MLNDSEYKKMIAGEFYNARDLKLVFMRFRAKEICRKYNKGSLIHYFTLVRWRIKRLLGSCGKEAYFVKPIFFDYGKNTTVGDYVFANTNLVVLDSAPVVIGNNAMLGSGVTIATPSHPMVADERIAHKYDEKKGPYNIEFALPITIEDNVWIASNVTVCGGVVIGEGSVIGAGSVVTKSIPKNSFAAGVPCRVIREITKEDRILPPNTKYYD